MEAFQEQLVVQLAQALQFCRTGAAGAGVGDGRQ